MLVGFIDCANTRMVQSRGSFCLALESGQDLGIASNFAGKKLKSDKPFQLDVLGLVDDTHATPAQLFHDVVMRDGFPEQKTPPERMYGVAGRESTTHPQMAIQRRRGPPRI